ncbi:peptide chain release factor family protein [Planctomycetota bacterium]
MEHLIYRLGVTPGKANALVNRLKQLGIKTSNVTEKFIRSSGRGGQKVNKTASCVYLKHIPSGIEVKMQRERSQRLNRFLAWRLLADKLELIKRARELKAYQKDAKLKRQNRAKPLWLKELILKTKKRHAFKKQLRQMIKDIDI